MAKALKQMLASQLEADLRDGAGLLMIDPGNLSVEASEAFRADLREKAGGARLRIIHNRTAKVAIANLCDANDGDLDDVLTGPSAVVYGGDGPISIARVVRDWRRKHKKMVLKAAIADRELMVDKDAEALADMPDLQQLKAMLLGAILGSARGIAVSLSAVYGGIARCIQARVDESGDEAGAGAGADAGEGADAEAGEGAGGDAGEGAGAEAGEGAGAEAGEDAGAEAGEQSGEAG